MNRGRPSEIGHACQCYALQALVALLGCIPLSLSGWIVKRVADIYFICSPTRRNIALDNLTIAYGDTLSVEQKSTIARQSFQNQALSILELLLVNNMKRDSSRRFSIAGRHHFDEAVSRGKGIVFVASHLGAWEYIGFPGYLTQYPHSVIVKKVKNPYLNNTIDALRRATDTVPIPKDVSALRRALDELRHNHGVAIVIDQWAGGEGIWVDFFGTATSTTSLPARLAKKTGCALIPIYCLRKAIGQYEIQILPGVPLSEDPAWEIQTTKRLNEMLESQIRQSPDQWSWSHRRWRPQPLTAKHSR